MAQRIVITPEEMENSARIIKERLDAITSESNLIKNEIDELSMQWEGAAKQAFMNQFQNDIYPILQKTVPEVVQGVAGELEAAATQMRDTDSQLASAFRG